jgi:hypothetical protein
VAQGLICGHVAGALQQAAQQTKRTPSTERTWGSHVCKLTARAAGVSGGMGRCPVKLSGTQIRARQPDRQLHFGVVQCAVHGLGRWTQNTPFFAIVCGADVITLAGSSKCGAPVCTELCCVLYARPSLTERTDNNAAANRTTTDAGGYSQRAAGGRRGAAFNFRGRRRGEPRRGEPPGGVTAERLHLRPASPCDRRSRGGVIVPTEGLAGTKAGATTPAA